MRFRMLGQMEAFDQERSLPLGGPRQRAVLAILLLRANEVVSTDRLVDEVWGDDPPQGARKTLQSYVAHLRSALGDVIEGRPPGYMASVHPDEVDALRFERLVSEAREAAAGDPSGAAARLRDALELWYGPPLGDLSDHPGLRGEASRLEELRLAAIEDRVEADLALGRHREVIGELESLTGRHPLRERLWGQLMVALYRSGRQAEALRVYQRMRGTLGDELGIEPSPELQRLHRAILDQDPGLEPGAAAEPRSREPTPGTAIRGYELRERVRAGVFGVVFRGYQPSVGREVAIKVIQPRFANDPDFIRRFELEAQTIARLEHPHIVPLYDFWRDADGAYLVMRWLQAGSVEDALTEGPWAVERVTRLLDHVASALGEAHRSGIVHRDVKPANLLLDDSGNTYLADFGIAVDALDPAGLAADEHASPYLSPEQRRGDPVTPLTDVFSLGVVLHGLLSGRLPPTDGPLLPLRDIRPDLPEAVDEVLRGATAERPGDRFPSVEALGAAFREAAEQAPGQEGEPTRVRNPYKGLRAFQEADEADFFGRERVVAGLLARLSEDGPTGRFVAVVGPSGSGKSSVVRAGLITAARAGAIPGSDRWFVAHMLPGADPMAEVEAALLRVAVDPPDGLMEQLERDDLGLLRAVGRCLPDERSTLLLVIDQFEEVFSLVSDEGERARFLAALYAAVTAPNSPLRLVITLRADFYDRPLLYREFGELLRRSLETVIPLSPEELVAVITRPAERRGVEIEEGLVAEIVADVMDQPGALPLLQYAMTELFERRRDGMLTREAYEAIGGVRGALGRRAEELYGRLDADGQEAARQLFLRLVTLGEGVEDTRRRVRHAEVMSIVGAREGIRKVMDLFGQHRLLSFDHDPLTRDPTVELAHEALLREWERLRGWIDVAREDLRLHRRVAATAEEWTGSGRDPSLLLRGSHLDRVETWARTSGLALIDAEQAFVEASAEARKAEDAAEEERRAHEARLERRALNRLRALVAVLGVALVLAGALSVFAFQQRDRVRAENLESRARELALFSAGNLQSDPNLSLLLAIEAARLTAEDRGVVLPEVRDALHWSLQAKQVQFPDDPPVALRLGPAGPRGVFDLPIKELLSFAVDQAPRSLRGEECRRYLRTARCPPSLERSTLGSLTVAGSDEEATEVPDRPLAGTEVRLLTGAIDPEEVGSFQASFAALERETGIRVISELILMDDRGQVTEGLDGDIVMTPQPALFVELARRGELMEVGRYLDVEQVREDYAPYLLRLVSVGEDGSWPADDGRLMGGWMKLNPKSLVWYPTPDFHEAGYEIPETWEELIELSDRMVAEGRTPWCFGIESGDVDGWVATDWIEDLLLREAGPEVYDRWAAHEIPFNHPAVRQAFRRLGEIAFAPRYVEGGAPGIVRTGFWMAQDLMFEDPPGCWLHRQASFAPAFFPAGSVAGIDTDAFPFPVVDPTVPPAMVGGGDIFAALTDRPEVREVVKFLLSPGYGVDWAGDATQGYISPNLRFDLDAYASPVTRAQAEAMYEALQADAFRFDASDLMPPEVGLGTFLASMKDYLERGPQDLDEVLREIDAAWPDD